MLREPALLSPGPGQAKLPRGGDPRAAGHKSDSGEHKSEGKEEPACHGDKWGQHTPRERGQKPAKEKKKEIQKRVLTTENREISLVQ